MLRPPPLQIGLFIPRPHPHPSSSTSTSEQNVCVVSQSISPRMIIIAIASHYKLSATKPTFDIRITSAPSPVPSRPPYLVITLWPQLQQQPPRSNELPWTDYYAPNSSEYGRHAWWTCGGLGHDHLRWLAYSRRGPQCMYNQRPPAIHPSIHRTAKEHSNRWWLGIFHVIIKLSRKVSGASAFCDSPHILSGLSAEWRGSGRTGWMDRIDRLSDDFWD